MTFLRNTFLVLGLALAATSYAQAQTAVAPAAAASAPVWKYKTKHLDRAAIDKLLDQPSKVLFVDVRRPEEIARKGTFPVYLNVQTAEVGQSLAYLPKDRRIVTVSNHAGRAGAVGDQLTAKGFHVAGAAGSEEYEEQGGKAVRRIAAPAPVAAAPQ